MQQADKQEFAMLITALASAFTREADEATLEGYWMALDDLPIEQVRLAVRAAMRQCSRMPFGQELRKLTGELSNSNRAVHAWSALQKAIGQHGAYRSVDFDDPVINATVRNMGGWQRLCAMNSEEFEKWGRKDFERIYSALCASGVSAEQVQHLLGIHEQENQAAGHDVPLPKRVETGLPPHPEGTVRELSAPEKLVLSGAARGNPPTISEREHRRRVAEIVGISGVNS